MKIGIVGAGHIGSTLAKLFVGAGHSVEIANSRGPQTLADVARDTGARPVTTEDAVRGKDMLVLTIPMKAVPNLPAGLFANVPATTPVIDTGNYYPQQRDGRIEPIENGLTESEWVAGQIGRATIKAFNNLNSKPLGSEGKPTGTPGRVALPVSGDDPVAKAKVMALIDEIGFDPIDNGALSESWRHQPGTPGYGKNLDVAGVHEQLKAASPVRSPQFRG